MSVTLRSGLPTSTIQVESLRLNTIHSWNQIGGPAGQIYAGDFGLVATNPKTGDLYHYVMKTPSTPAHWARISGPGRSFALDGTDRLFKLNDSGVYQYIGNGSNDYWLKIGGPAGQIYAGDFGLVATNPKTGDLYHYLELPDQWARIGGPGRSFTLGGYFGLYRLSPDGSGVYQYTGDGRNDSWIKIGGPADAIVASGFGDTALYVLSPGTHNVWRYS